MKTTLVAFFIFGLVYQLPGQELPLLKVSEDRKYIVTEDGTPFFWLGDTAWELIHRLKKSEVDYYLCDRAEKGFTVIQTVILAEQDGLNTPNAYGEIPLIDNDPCKYNEKYFDHVDYVVQQAGQLGLYVALLPAWGDKFNKGRGKGPEILHPENAEAFGRLMASRYYSASNIIWVLGGDRNPEIPAHFETISALAKGIRDIDNRHLITFHPRGGKIASKFFNEDWLDIDMFQTGHRRTVKDYQFVIDARKNPSIRPIINGEARYENIPDRLRAGGVWLDDADVRTSAYWSILSGAAGYTYGCNDIWQFFDDSRKPLVQARTDWKIALDLPGSLHMKYMKDFFTSIPWQQMLPAQSLILNNNPEDELYTVCAMSSNNDLIIAYTPLGYPIELDLSPLNAEAVSAFWFNPRSGSTRGACEFSPTGSHIFEPWATGWGSDFVLVAIDKEKQEMFLEKNPVKATLEESANVWVSEQDTLPYPLSDLIASVSIDSQRISIGHGDNWAITWADDDRQYSFFTDGKGFGSLAKKVSIAPVTISGNPPDIKGEDIPSESGTFDYSGGGDNSAKVCGLLMVNEVMYAWLRNLNLPGTPNGTGSTLMYSYDYGKNWEYVDWNWPSIGYPVWLNAGKNYGAAQDEYAYFISPDGPSAYYDYDSMLLARVKTEYILRKEMYSFYTGTDEDGEPQWGNYSDRKAFFKHRHGCFRPTIVYNPGLKRYILAIASPYGNWHWWADENLSREPHLGLFEAQHPWGPWKTILYEKNWGKPENRFSPQIPSKWISDDGKSFYLLYSCIPNGPYKFNIQKCKISIR